MLRSSPGLAKGFNSLKGLGFIFFNQRNELVIFRPRKCASMRLPS